MSQIKIATFNTEWMISLFGGQQTKWNGTMPASYKGTSMYPAIKDCAQVARRLAGVIKEVDAGIIGIEEGPYSPEQMEMFVDKYLDGDYAVHFSNRKQQSICALVHRDIASKVTSFALDDPEVKSLSGNFWYYPWVAFKQEDRKKHKFDRVPLVLRFTPQSGKELRIVVVHTKSKYSKLKQKKQWVERDEEAVLDALDARQKLSAEVAGLRSFLNAQIEAVEEPRPMIVIGDFNDGPFHDVIEQEFLIHNILDELVGSFLDPDLYFKHAMEPKTLRSAWTVDFDDPLQDGQTVRELIDHVLVSPGIWQGTSPFSVKQGSCRMETAAYDQYNDPNVAGHPRDARPSDHRPVSVLLEY